jgi:enterochelin esterase family protein
VRGAPHPTQIDLLVQQLAAQGYDLALHVNADAHNWVAWRDTWDPHLVDLLHRVWS